MDQELNLDYMAFIQTVMTVAGVAFAIATFAPEKGYAVYGRPLVPGILLLASLSLTGSAMVGIDGLRDHWHRTLA